MKTLREQLEQVKANIKQPLTPLQKLQADNERRREEVDGKLSDLQDKKSIRSIGGILAQPFLGGAVRNKIMGASGVGAKVMNTGYRQIATKSKGKYIDLRDNLYK